MVIHLFSLELKMCACLTMDPGYHQTVFNFRLSISLQIPRQMSGFHMHAVIPVIQVVVNSITQPQLCHATLTFIREVSNSLGQIALHHLCICVVLSSCYLINTIHTYIHYTLIYYNYHWMIMNEENDSRLIITTSKKLKVAQF